MAELERLRRSARNDLQQPAQGASRVAVALACCEPGDRYRNDTRGDTVSPELDTLYSRLPAFEQIEDGSQRDRHDRIDLVRMEAVGIEWKIRAEREDLLYLVVRASCARREAAAEPCDVPELDQNADLLLGLAHCLGERLAGAKVPTHGDVEGAGPGVLRVRSSLEEREGQSACIDAPDPDVECPVPVPVAMDIATALSDPRALAVLFENVEQLVLWVGRSRVAQNRSSTFWSAPASMCCSVSSSRPGRTSRWTMPSSSIRYWPTQSSRGE